MATTAKNFPYPVTADGRPHIDLAIAALAQKVDAVFDALSDAEMALLLGADLWDGELRIQTDAGAVRKWRGLYEYRTTGAAWTPLVALGAHAFYTPVWGAVTTAPNIGTTATQVGWYVQMGKRIFGRGRFVVAGTGITAGSGSYRISLPVACGLAGAPVIGRWQGFSPGAPPHNFVGALQLVDTTHVKLMWLDAVTAGELRSDTTTYSMAATASLDFQFLYRMS